MNVSITVKTSNLEKFAKYMGNFPDDILDVSAQELHDYLIEYHEKMDWQGRDWFAGEKSGEFAKKVVEGWQAPTRSGNSIEIQNTFGLLKWKTTGGFIGPKRATYLTIPLIYESRGKLVAEFNATTGQRLFKAGRALCRKVGTKVEAVYALSLGVNQFPVAGAMPSKTTINRAVQSAANRFARSIQ